MEMDVAMNEPTQRPSIMINESNRPRRRKWRTLAGVHVTAERPAENGRRVHGTHPVADKEPLSQSLNAFDLASKFHLN